MPRISRRTPRAYARLTVTQLFALVSGHDFFAEWRTAGGALDLPAMREAWQALGAELLALHIEQHPGTRPWPWWAFDAPEPRRRRVDGKPHPFDDQSVPVHHQTLYYGCPGFLQSDDHFDAMYESQATYLKRLKLLTAEEHRKLQYPDWVGTGVYDDETPSLSLEVIRAWYGQEE